MTTQRPFRYWSRLILAGLGALLLLFLSVLGASGARGRAGWLSNAFQAINLEPVPVFFEARFLAPDGTLAYIFTDTLLSGEACFYQPTEMGLPETFSGTMVLDADGQVAMEVLHLSEMIMGGNMILEGVADELLGPSAYTPVDSCTRLHVHNLVTETTDMALAIYNPGGGAVDSSVGTLVPEGTILFHIGDFLIPADFVGAAVITAEHPIEVTVDRYCGGAGAFVASPEGDTTLFAPLIPPHNPGWMTSTLAVQNVSSVSPTNVTILFSNEVTVAFSLAPFGSAIMPSPLAIAPGFAVVHADQPVVASVAMQSRITNTEGAFIYRALGLGEATRAVALPIVFAGYEGWSTKGGIWGDNLWVQNVGVETATVSIRYVTVPTGTVVWQEGAVPPGAIWQVELPSLPEDLAGATLRADQPIVALVGAFNVSGTIIADDETVDRWLLYRGANYTLTLRLIYLPLVLRPCP